LGRKGLGTEHERRGEEKEGGVGCVNRRGGEVGPGSKI
jgi:hypothetical protein